MNAKNGLKWLWGIPVLLLIMSMVPAMGGSRVLAEPGGPSTIYIPVVSNGSGRSGSAQVLPNSSTYFDGYFRRHVVGEVQNVGDLPLGPVQVKVKFFDSTGALAAETISQTMLGQLASHDSTCFDAFVVEPPDFASYTVEVIGDPVAIGHAPKFSTPEEIGVDFDSTGVYQVTGSVRNMGVREVENVVLAVTLYGSQEEVIDCDFNSADSSTLAPGESSAVSVYLMKRGLDDYAAMVSSVRFQLDGKVQK